MKYADVVLPVPVDKSFTYSIPGQIRGIVRRGYRVLVPLGKGYRIGYVIGTANEKLDIPTRSIVDIVEPFPAFTEEIMSLSEWVAKYYLAPLGLVLKSALPASVHIESEITLHLISIPERKLNSIEKKIVNSLSNRTKLSLSELRKLVNKPNLNFNLQALIDNGYIEKTIRKKEKIKPHIEKHITVSPDVKKTPIEEIIHTHLKRKSKRRELFEFLYAHPDRNFPLTRISAEYGDSAYRGLLSKNLARVVPVEVQRMPTDGWLEEEKQDFTLTSHQKKALERITESIDSERSETFLLFGITGSGKTEIYLRTMEKVLAKGRSVLILVPEISLTPQLWGRLRARFGENVAVWHSQMPDSQRYDIWRSIRKGKTRIVLGARSAVFAPLDNLGLIIVDEEHEPSYKQEEPRPYYNARDIAIVRGKLAKATVILGSATPSVESFYNAQIGKYTLLRLPERVPGSKLPNVTIVDMKVERENKNFDSFSASLKEKIIQNWKAGKNTILLLNRRGYASYIQCPNCGWTDKCPNCNIPLTYHIKNYELVCHWCGYKKRAPERCPECGYENIRLKGRGTERVERDLQSLLEDIPAIRLDHDTSREQNSPAEFLKQFIETPGAVLVGTQMVSKGLDIPEVALVGVISADTGLNFPDFRASERTFQLLTQVAGRAGRTGDKGEVIIQTYYPEASPIQFALKQDYERFYEREIKEREELSYPPFIRIIRVVASGKETPLVRNTIWEIRKKVGRLARESSLRINILGPAPAHIEKLRGRFRWNFLIKTRSVFRTLELLKLTVKNIPRRVKVKVDVDPVNLL